MNEYDKNNSKLFYFRAILQKKNFKNDLNSRDSATIYVIHINNINNSFSVN